VSATPSIEVKHLRKVYGEIVAVDDLAVHLAQVLHFDGWSCRHWCHPER